MIFQTNLFICDYCGEKYAETNEESCWSDPVIDQPEGWNCLGKDRCPKCYHNRTLDEINNDKYGNAKGVNYHDYFPKYEDAISRGVPIKTILEIGVHEGQSLQIWRERWPEAKVYGIDVGGERNHIEGTKVFCGNQTDPDFMQQVIAEIGTNIDLIIDDGSHVTNDFMLSLLWLFPILSPGGIYIIEDITTGELFNGSLFQTMTNNLKINYWLQAGDQTKVEVDNIELYRGKREQWMLIIRKTKPAHGV